MRVATSLSLSVLFAIPMAKAQVSDMHECHVFVAEAVDSGVDVTLGRFDTAVKLNTPTTKSFPWPGRGLVVTATALYTERSLPLSKYSMTLGIVASEAAAANAITSTGAALAQVSLEPDTFIVSTRQRLLLDGKPWIVGVQCQTMTDASRQLQIRELQEQ